MADNSVRFNVGHLECLVVSDGTLIVPDSMPGDASGRPDMSHGQKMDVSSIVINSGNQKVLVDTGCGSSFGPTTGKLVENLAASGIQPGDIDIIIHTHGHMDHVAGSFDAEGKPIYTNARYIAAKKEWDCWVNRPERKQLSPMFSAARKFYLQMAEKFELVEDQSEPIPGFKFMIAPGHTPGGIALEIASGRNRLLCIGDMIHTPLEFSEPGKYAFLDVDPEQALLTRERILTEAARTGQPVFACHFAFPGLGRIVKKGEVLSWRPAQLGN
jgi:glyoxylase-like metal-dependent hydrolase (beta-lactamase superfamily II)